MVTSLRILLEKRKSAKKAASNILIPVAMNGSDDSIPL